MFRKSFHRTRLAPTPSGFLHIGNIFSFALTAALARKTGASIMLRIDDMDRDRVEPAYVNDIFNMLSFLKIPWDEGPRTADDFQANFSQITRIDFYRDALEKLARTGMVYACECSRKQIAENHGGAYPGTCKGKNIPLQTPNVAWRLNTDLAQRVRLNGSDIDFPPEMRHFIVRKKDGFPAYQLTSMVDDLHYGVDMIIRGNDLLHSTLAQLFLADVLGETAFKNIYFYHHRLLTDVSGQKLSKSAGATSIQFLRQNGASASDVYSMIGQHLGLTLNKWQDFDIFFDDLSFR